MNAEDLLKSISELIKKNEQFFIDNPEVFSIIEQRLHKAIDYEDYEPEEDDEEDFYNDAYDESGISDLFDNIPEEDIDEDMDGEIESDEAAQWLRENDAAVSDAEAQDIDGDGDVDLPEQTQQEIAQVDKQTDKPKVSRSGYREWAARDKYEDHHQQAIEKLMAEGWSHREAERMAGAHDSPTDFQSALKHKIKPSQPSERMLQEMRSLAGDWLRNAERKIGELADARKNPIKHASAKALTAHEDVHGDFHRAYNEFLNSDDVKELRGRERHKAIRAFKDKWHTENPDLRERAIAAADTGKKFKEAEQARAQHLLEGHEAVQDVGKLDPNAGSAGEFSSAASGASGGKMTSQGAAQMAGGSKEEGGYTSGVAKDPAMVFAEGHKDYLSSEARKKSIDNLKSKLSPEQLQRFSALKGLKKSKEGEE